MQEACRGRVGGGLVPRRERRGVRVEEPRHERGVRDGDGARHREVVRRHHVHHALAEEAHEVAGDRPTGRVKADREVDAVAVLCNLRRSQYGLHSGRLGSAAAAAFRDAPSCVLANCAGRSRC